MSTDEGGTTRAAAGGASRQAQGGGAGWWLPGALAIVVFAFFPVPWDWPPAGAAALLPGSSDWPAVAAFGVGFVAFLVVRRWILPGGRVGNARVGWCIGFVALQALLLRIAIEARPFVIVNTRFEMPEPALVFPWIVPVGLATVLFGFRHGFVVATATAALAWLAPGSGTTPLWCAGLLLAGFLGVLGLRRCPLRWHVIRGCFRAGAVFGAVALAGTLFRTRGWEELVVATVVPVIMGGLAGVFLLAVLPFAEWLTGSLSDITLIEFASDHRLLDKLRAEAPGTWNHTINVADLAESAARAIGANALFCRTAALFHDIGKTVDPEIFAENQRNGSPHDKLTPQESAEKIIAHVTDGLSIAQKHRLPRPFRAIIAEHHGTSLARFFYSRAAEQVDDPAERELLREKFRYPGPPPSTRESGIIALADTVEAAARSAEQLDEARIRDLVQSLVSDRIKEGELRDCPLTLAELAKVEASFIAMLTSRHHKRPAYPKTGDASESAPLAEAGSRKSKVKSRRS